MAIKKITWPDDSTATLIYNGQGSGTITVQSEPNNHYETRSAQITVRTTDGSGIERTVTIVQAAKVRTDISNAVVTAANQTYSGTAKTPTPTVTLNGETIPSSGYDVAYSDNTNAGTATITVIGKGDYTGTATGTFTIAKANPTYTAPTARTGLTYSGSSQYLVNAGSTSHGAIQYSSNGTSWSTTRPSSTNAGSYTTYWRLVGDANHNDVESTSLSTTIAKANRTLSFANSYVVLDTSSNVTKTATPSAGSGDGAITYTISSTTYATINSSSGKVTSKTSDGSAIVTATIAEGVNYLSATASYNLYVFATTHNYDYNGSYRSVTLPPGKYQFQCWGAQGGSNAADSTYGITAQAGGKGGYSVGQLTISQATDVVVYVGGQGSSSGTGGFNGGGATNGSISSEKDVYTRRGRSASGGGGTDIRLSDGSLYSRMIVAGGGSGGAMSYLGTKNNSSISVTEYSRGTYKTSWSGWTHAVDGTIYLVQYDTSNIPVSVGDILNISVSNATQNWCIVVNWINSSDSLVSTILDSDLNLSSVSIPINSIPSSAVKIRIQINCDVKHFDGTMTVARQYTTNSTVSQVGYVGGGTTGGGYSNDFKGKQNAAGTVGGAFGQGGSNSGATKVYSSGGGGGGWYGGGTYWSTDINNGTQRSGGGSGFVNVAASAGNRPSGYTGLQLDSGSTTAGNTSFPAPGGGNETGHAGNGYARITRLS